MSNKITSYFVNKKTVNPTEISNVNSEKICNTFYRDCLSSQNNCLSSACAEKKSSLQDEINIIEAKCKRYEEAINVCSSVLSKKDEKIANLQKMTEMAAQKDEQMQAIDTNENQNQISTENPIENDMPFNEFANLFSQKELAVLRSFGSPKCYDPKFISTALRYMYADRLSCLKNKSVTGRMRNGRKKEHVTPEKMLVFEKMFHQRVEFGCSE